MRKCFLALVLIIIGHGTSHADDPSGTLRPAALAFAEKNPLTAENYRRNANSYLAVSFTKEVFDAQGNSSKSEVPTQAKEFSAFTAGLFVAFTAEETLSCLSWQTFDEVVEKHAKLAVGSKEIKYPLLSALVNLKLACMTEQEAAKISAASSKKAKPNKSGKQP